jgi:hypothetical protein
MQKSHFTAILTPKNPKKMMKIRSQCILAGTDRDCTAGWGAEVTVMWVAVARGVALARWQWYHSTQRVSAVRMVLDSMCGCGCGGGWVAVRDFGKKVEDFDFSGSVYV